MPDDAIVLDGNRRQPQNLRTAIFGGALTGMRIYVLVLDQVFDLGLSAVLDAFETANDLIALSGLDVPAFDVSIVGARKAVKISHGFSVGF